MGLIGSQKRQPPKGEALKRSTDTPGVHHVRRPCPIRDRTGASYYLLHCEGIAPPRWGAKPHEGRRLLCGDGNTCVACRDGLDAITLDPRRAEEEVCFPFLGIGSVGDEDELTLSVVHLEGNDILPPADLYGLARDDRLASLDNAWLILVEISVVIGDVL